MYIIHVFKPIRPFSAPKYVDMNIYLFELNWLRFVPCKMVFNVCEQCQLNAIRHTRK